MVHPTYVINLSASTSYIGTISGTEQLYIGTNPASTSYMKCFIKIIFFMTRSLQVHPTWHDHSKYILHGMIMIRPTSSSTWRDQVRQYIIQWVGSLRVLRDMVRSRQVHQRAWLHRFCPSNQTDTSGSNADAPSAQRV